MIRVCVVIALFSLIIIGDMCFCLQQLQSYTLEQLNELWQEITGQTSVRMGYIKVLDSHLQAIENDRITMVRFNNLK